MDAALIGGASIARRGRAVQWIFWIGW